MDLGCEGRHAEAGVGDEGSGARGRKPGLASVGGGQRVGRGREGRRRNPCMGSAVRLWADGAGERLPLLHWGPNPAGEARHRSPPPSVADHRRRSACLPACAPGPNPNPFRLWDRPPPVPGARSSHQWGTLRLVRADPGPSGGTLLGVGTPCMPHRACHTMHDTPCMVPRAWYTVQDTPCMVHRAWYRGGGGGD